MTVGHRRHAIGEEPLLFEKHREDVEKILNQYPADHQRSAVMPLLFLAQQEEGFVEEHAVREIASMLNLEPTQVASLIGFYTLYHQKAGREIPHPDLHGSTLCIEWRGRISGRDLHSARHRAAWGDGRRPLLC